MGVNQESIGKVYDTTPRTVTAEEMERYALATDETNPIFMTGTEGQIAPPMFSVKPLLEVLFGVLFDMSNGIDMTRLVHGEQEMQFIKPLTPGTVVTPKGTFTEVIVKPSGELLIIDQRLEGEDGTTYATARSTMFIRARGKKKESNKRTIQPPELEEPIHTMVQHVALDQTDRYAAASGDHNPIHLDDMMAKAAGLPGRILHGLCTMAFASRALIESAAAGDPRRLDMLSVRFAKPVTLDQELTFVVKPIKGIQGMFTVEAKNEEGQDVLTRVEAKFRQA